MSIVSFPALRPSLPHGCRKRSSGYGCLWATDEEASGGGSVKGSPQTESTKATARKSVSRLPQFSRIPSCGDNNTCKAAPACAPQRSPHTYVVTTRSAFRCPRRHVHHTDHSMRRILIERPLHGAQSFAAYRLPMCRMLIPCPRRTDQRHAGYDSAPHPMRTRSIPDARIMRPRFCADACSFVRRYPAGPAYVSSIRCAYGLTAGKGRCPFEPRKAQRQGKR